MRKSRSLQDRDSAVGWISMTDMFLICMVLGLIIFLGAQRLVASLRLQRDASRKDVLGLAVSMKEQEDHLRERRQEIEDRETEIRSRERMIEDLGWQIAFLRAEVARLTELQEAPGLPGQEESEVSLAELERQIREKERELEEVRIEFGKLRAVHDVAVEESGRLADLEERQREQLKGLRTELGNLRRQVSALVANLASEKKKADEAEEDLAAKRKQIADLERQVARGSAGWGTIRKELVGLKGRSGGALDRVLFLFDTSGSMEKRWRQTVSLVETWLEHLEIGSCALILYDTDVRLHPKNGRLLSVRGRSGKANREQLIQELRRSTAGGSTDTLAALTEAYTFQEIDCIILFSDGAPTSPTSFRASLIDERMIEEIYSLVGRYRVPINTIALGDFYRKKEHVEFLIELARRTGGSFLARWLE